MWFKILLGSILVISFLLTVEEGDKNKESARNMACICVASIIALSILFVFYK